eukprot:scaffold11091_cov75-Phaeocystis_antarctica.AAC.15
MELIGEPNIDPEQWRAATADSRSTCPRENGAIDSRSTATASARIRRAEAARRTQKESYREYCIYVTPPPHIYSEKSMQANWAIWL